MVNQNSIIDALIVLPSLQCNSSFWERERREKEEQLSFGKYEGWDSLIRLGLYIGH